MSDKKKAHSLLDGQVEGTSLAFAGLMCPLENLPHAGGTEARSLIAFSAEGENKGNNLASFYIYISLGFPNFH